jgi:hypothetical protein
MEEKYRKKLNFISSLPCFAQQRRKVISAFIMMMTKQKYLHGQTIYKQGQAATSVYIV